ncbi:hypothetical protein [Rhodococcus xishaensis]|uniref:hypothetical protein n=1 Tax=Rhodococcus xishaensis TaxID=2487364 RepID=UPI0013E3907D|nr:hypothetical protein [Rhodococcus xishaensis]
MATLTFDGSSRLFRLPQWLLQLLIAVLALLGSALVVARSAGRWMVAIERVRSGQPSG